MRRNKSTTAMRIWVMREEERRCLWFTHTHTPVPFVLLDEKMLGEERKKEKKCRLVEDIDPFSY